MKIFNTKRKLAINSGRIKNYFAYAIGEIILVVAGIVIGLQINNWNSVKTKEKKIDNYYSRINEEVDFSLKLIQNNTKYSEGLIEGLAYCLESMSEKRVDSLFVKNLSFLTDNEQQTFFFPAIDEFLELGYLTLIPDLSLREQFQSLEYYRKQSDVDDANVQTFSEKVLKPRLADKLNYLDIDLMNFDSRYFKKLEFDDDHENDYEKLTDDLVIWNLIVYRMDIEKNRLNNNKSLINVLGRIMEKTAGHQVG